MNKTALNSQKEKHFMLSLRRATPALLPITVSISQFLSTISLRRATVPWPTVSPPTPNFYPRSPCGERLDLSGLDTVCRAISIHALLAESDARNSPHRPRKSHFYPRSPCGERLPCAAALRLYNTDISIHALLAESDWMPARQRQTLRYFYPRSPCGERRCVLRIVSVCSEFLSTLSLRRATLYGRLPCCMAAPAFLSTLSLRRATLRYSEQSAPPKISIHALLAESDRVIRRPYAKMRISIHALLAESDTRKGQSSRAGIGISIHALLAESDRIMIITICTVSKFLSTLSLRRATHNRWINLFGFQDFYPRSPCGERPGWL